MTTEYKVCTKCGESKPATAEFFYKFGKRNSLRGECKYCRNSYHRDKSTSERGHPLQRWRGMMRRCYSADHKNYDVYGERGVAVCDKWHNYDVFVDWHDKHYISGWKMDKDILGGTNYSPECCVFVPHLINTFFIFKNQPTIERRSKKYSVNVKIKGKTQHLVADTEEDVLEQFYLFKELYLEKLVWEMKEEHKRLCEKYPNTPQISPKLLSILENFSTREYLEMKSSLINQ